MDVGDGNNSQCFKLAILLNYSGTLCKKETNESEAL